MQNHNQGNRPMDTKPRSAAKACRRALAALLLAAPLAALAAPSAGGYTLVSATPGLAEAVAQGYAAPADASLVEKSDAMLRAAQAAGFHVIGGQVRIDPCSKVAFVNENRRSVYAFDHIFRAREFGRPEGLAPGELAAHVADWKAEVEGYGAPTLDLSMRAPSAEDPRSRDPNAGCSAADVARPGEPKPTVETLLPRPPRPEVPGDQRIAPPPGLQGLLMKGLNAIKGATKSEGSGPPPATMQIM